ncbi:MAG TPA: tetratricopeptide repeat protein [Bryobacteraceae bacterium]
MRTLFLLPVFAAALLAQQDHTEAMLKEAIRLHQAGQVEAAIGDYQKYLSLRPDSFLAHSNLGAAYAKTGRYEDAVEQYQVALKLQPDNASIELNLGLAWYKSGQTQRAATIFDSLHKRAPGELQTTLLLADCLLAMGKDKDVVSLLSALGEQRPDDLAVSYMLGTALARDGQIERGQVIIDRILRNGDTAEARLLLGTTKLRAQEYPAALVDLAKAVELNPKLPDVYTYYGQALLATGDSSGAVEAFRKALAANPNDFGSNMQLAILLKEDDKMDEALQCLNRALRVRPGDLGARYQHAGILLHDNKTEDARTELEAIVAEAPGFTEAHVTLATVYYRLKRKADGDRERALVQKLTAQTQAKQQQGINQK